VMWWDLECVVGDQVLLRVSPTKGIVCFGTTGKISPSYIGHFNIIAKVEAWLIACSFLNPRKEYTMFSMSLC
jgi:hypothetical protein